jgi:hypothetical protein
VVGFAPAQALEHRQNRRLVGRHAMAAWREKRTVGAVLPRIGIIRVTHD